MSDRRATLPAATLLALGLAAAGVWIAWRHASAKRSLPCPSWLGWLVELDNPLFRNNRAEAIVAGLAVAPGMRVADLGCGPGRLTLPLARAVGETGHVLAVDLQAAMLSRMEGRARAEGLSWIEPLQAALGGGALPVGRFDRITLATVLGELPDQAAAMAEIAAALVPGGRLAVTEVIADPHFQSRPKVKALAEGAGLVEMSRSGGAVSFTLYFEKPPA